MALKTIAVSVRDNLLCEDNCRILEVLGSPFTYACDILDRQIGQYPCPGSKNWNLKKKILSWFDDLRIVDQLYLLMRTLQVLEWEPFVLLYAANSDIAVNFPGCPASCCCRCCVKKSGKASEYCPSIPSVR